jgi:hypothetical protein
MCHRDEIRRPHSHIQPATTAGDIDQLEAQCRFVNEGWVSGALTEWTDATRVIPRPAFRIGHRSHACFATASGLGECFQINGGEDWHDGDDRRIVDDADQRFEHFSWIAIQCLGRLQPK